MYGKRSTASAPDIDSLFYEVDADIRRLKREQRSTQRRNSTSCASTTSVSHFARLDRDALPWMTYEQYTNMKRVGRAINASIKELDSLQSLLDSASKEKYRDVSDVQNKTVLIEALRQKRDDLEKRLAERRNKLIEIREAPLNEYDHDLIKAANMANLREVKNLSMSGQCVVIRNLIKKRRQELVAELFKTFRIEIGLLPTTNRKDCNCESVDQIYEMHLPSIGSIPGHSDIEISAALGQVVNLLRCISWILDIPLPYPLNFASSRSQIYDPRSNKIFPLFGSKSKSDRVQLETGIRLLNADIAQLRLHFGFDSPCSMTLRLLHDIHLWVAQCRVYPTIVRPFSCIYSPALLVETGQDYDLHDDNWVNLSDIMEVSTSSSNDLSPLPSPRMRYVTMGEEAIDLASSNDFSQAGPSNR